MLCHLTTEIHNEPFSDFQIKKFLLPVVTFETDGTGLQDSDKNQLVLLYVRYYFIQSFPLKYIYSNRLVKIKFIQN